MIEISIENKSIQMYTDWSEITFGTYIDIININKDKFSDMEKGVRILAALSLNNKEEALEMLFKLTPQQFEELSEYFTWLKEDFQTYIDNYKFEEKESFEIDGQNYVIKKDFDKLNMGEMVSLEVYLQNFKNLDPFEIAFGLLFRKVGPDGSFKEFDEVDFLETIHALKDKVKLVDVFKYISFFLGGGKSSTTKNLQGFSVRKL